LRMLHFLASSPGRVFTRDQLLDHSTHGGSHRIAERNVDVHVRDIRKKMGKHRDLIETVRGVGYRFQDQAG
ncbi:MAG: winged helix-turn-helix domain-containing protein, partial [Planctomycetota bacterium]